MMVSKKEPQGKIGIVIYTKSGILIPNAATLEKIKKKTAGRKAK